MISIIIPCFNEGSGIRQLASKLEELELKLTEPHELIFVDDGSSDSTYGKLCEIYKEREGRDVKIIRHLKNKNVGAAIKTGIANASYEYIAVIDSDCTYEPTYLAEMLKLLKQQNADIITASPYHPKGRTESVPAHRLFLSKGLSMLYNFVSGSNYHTYTSMFRIYKANAIKEINFQSDGFLAMAEILIKAHKKGFKILEYPATLRGRAYGISNAKTPKMIREHLFFIMRILLGKE